MCVWGVRVRECVCVCVCVCVWNRLKKGPAGLPTTLGQNTTIVAGQLEDLGCIQLKRERGGGGGGERERERGGEDFCSFQPV